MTSVRYMWRFIPLILLLGMLLISGISEASGSSPNFQATAVISPTSSNLPTIDPNILLQPMATPSISASAAISEVLGTVNGVVTNGTGAEKAPTSLAVELHIFVHNPNEQVLQATTDAQGKYSFNNVTIDANHLYVVTANYKGHSFSSETVLGDPAKGTLDLPIKIYEVTSDPTAVTITALITQINASTAGIQAAQIIRVKNNTDRVFVTDQIVDKDTFAAVTIPIPSGASVMGFSDSSGRFLVAPDNMKIIDTRPLLPNEEQAIHVIYRLTTTTDKLALTQPLNYALNGTLRLLVYPESLGVNSTQFTAQSSQVFNGQTYRIFEGTSTLPAGETVQLELTGLTSLPAAAPLGNPTTIATTQQTNIVPRELLIVGLVGIGLLMTVAGVILLMRNRRHNADEH